MFRMLTQFYTTIITTPLFNKWIPFPNILEPNITIESPIYLKSYTYALFCYKQNQQRSERQFKDSLFYAHTIPVRMEIPCHTIERQLYPGQKGNLKRNPVMTALISRSERQFTERQFYGETIYQQSYRGRNVTGRNGNSKRRQFTNITIPVGTSILRGDNSRTKLSRSERQWTERQF